MVGLCFEDMKGNLSPIHRKPLSLVHLLLSSLSSCLDDNIIPLSVFYMINLSQYCSLISFNHNCILSTSHPPKVDQNVPLGMAAQEAHTDIVEQLIRAGAIIDNQNKVT